MLSFYQRLAEKLNDGNAAAANAPASAKSVTYNAAGNRMAPAAPQQQPQAAANDPAAAAAPQDPIPDGAEPLNVDLFQSESRMVLFVQMGGVATEDFELMLDEEANTLTIQATQ